MSDFYLLCLIKISLKLQHLFEIEIFWNIIL